MRKRGKQRQKQKQKLIDKQTKLHREKYRQESGRHLKPDKGWNKRVNSVRQDTHWVW